MLKATCLAALAVVLTSTTGMAQTPLTRFFVLPDSGPAPGSDSMFTGTAGATPFAFDFSESLRFNRGGYVTLSQDAASPYVWNVLDFKLPATDLGLGSNLTFERAVGPGPHGTWTSSSPIGFPDWATVTIAMTGDFSATPPLSGAFPSTATLTLSGTTTPGFYHNILPLTGSFTGVAGSVALLLKNDFFPPAVAWDMVVRPASSSAMVAGTPVPVTGGVSMQRGIVTPSVYALQSLAFTVASAPPAAITTPPGGNAGTLAFDPATRVVSGTLALVIDGLPVTIPVDGIGDSFEGAAMRPTLIVVDEAGAFGSISALHLEISGTELVPAEPPLNDFQIGLVTSIVMRGRAGSFYGCGASFTPVPGINTPVGDIPVMGDWLLSLSLDPTNPFFLNTTGFMPASGEVLVSVVVPPDPILIGATFFMGGATLDAATLAVLAATNSHRAIVK